MAFRLFAGSPGFTRSFLASRRMMPDAILTGGLSSGAQLRHAPSPWVRFTWQLASLPEALPGISSSDLIRSATREESDKVLDVMVHSLLMDPAWNDSLVKTEQYLKEAVSRHFDQEEPFCLVIPKGNRFIAASLLDPAVDAPTHLVSGPAVLVEYRNRGIGSRLLQASLAALRSKGLSTVKGITRANSVASRYVYSKFGGGGEAVQFSPQTEGLQEAKA